MTNLSKELCEICGIEPKMVEKRCKECDLIIEECGCFDCYKEVYPNFEQPENFVKLLEIINKEMSMGAFLICNLYYEYSFTIEFLRLLKIFLNGGLEYGECVINKIKQAIRKTEWIYE